MINKLLGCDRLKTSEIRQKDGKGRHTSTRREMMLLPNGGVVIDTPGMRELGIDSADFSKSFADIDALVSQCRYTIVRIQMNRMRGYGFCTKRRTEHRTI